MKVGMEADEYFVVKCSLRWECVLSPWMFNIFANELVKEVNEKILGNENLRVLEG